MKPIISICFGTLQRIAYLKRAVESARRACGEFPFEFVIADGGSDDGTLEYLREQKDVTLIEIGERTGAVFAFNQAFSRARGEFVAAFNDDAACIGTPFADAVKMMRADKMIGQVAIPYATDERETPHTELVNTERYGKVCFANFGVIRRELGEMTGWWSSNGGDGQQYFQYGGDTELSVKVWYVGYRVVPLRAYRPGARLTDADSRIIHYLADDDTRVPNVEAALFRAKWQGRNGATPTLAPVDNSPTVTLRYLGKRNGSITYQKGGSPHKYSVSATNDVVTVGREDAAWFLDLKERGRRVFERMTQ